MHSPSSAMLHYIKKLLHFSPVSFLLLFVPATIAVIQANAFADYLYDWIQSIVVTALDRTNTLPEPLAAMFGGNYGVLAMLPFLLLYALPTILIFSALISAYKNSGLINYLSYGLHPLLKPFGLSGQDLVRIVMGFGCNVPAVVATRSCSCTARGTCVSAIAHGSACSYQLSSTIAIFAATGLTYLAPLYIGLLGISTLIYLRVIRPTKQTAVDKSMDLPLPKTLRLPSGITMFREISQTFKEFLLMALPIFIGICIVSGLLEWSGVLSTMTQLLAPIMTIFNLPPEAALSVVLGSVRKDGIAIGLLDADWNTLKVALDTPLQVLTIVYLAGVLLPCLVTVFTVAKEMKLLFALKMIAKQACFAIICSLCIAWLGLLFIH